MSRDGWAIYQDDQNAMWDETQWWSTSGIPRAPSTCAGQQASTDAAAPSRSADYPDGITVASVADCCTACTNDTSCTAYVFDTAADSPNCWPLADTGGAKSNSPNRILGAMNVAPGPLGPQFNTNVHDLYGFFHGNDYRGAIGDYVQIGGRTAMVLKQASGIWWSRWFDVNNADTRKIIEDYESRDLPMSTYVIE